MIWLFDLLQNSSAALVVLLKSILQKIVAGTDRENIEIMKTAPKFYDSVNILLT